MKNFSNKDVFEMSDKELAIEFYADELNIKYIEKQLRNSKAVQFENNTDIIIFHPCTKNKKFPYQITYIWKKNKKPFADTLCLNLKEAAERIYDNLNNIKEYETTKKILKVGA